MRSKEPERCVIVAPTHLKFVGVNRNSNDFEDEQGYLDQNQQIGDVWTAMEREINDSRALVFIGYSFPIGDLYFSSLIRSVLARREKAPAFVLVNPDGVTLAERLSKRFKIERPVLYFDMEQFVNATRQDVFDQLKYASF